MKFAAWIRKVKTKQKTKLAKEWLLAKEAGDDQAAKKEQRTHKSCSQGGASVEEAEASQAEDRASDVLPSPETVHWQKRGSWLKKVPF